MAYSQWMSETDLLSEALELQGPLAHALRQDGMCELEGMFPCNNWQPWVEAESRRRAKLVGFAFLNLQTVFYNTPSLMFTTEIHLLLPCTSVAWAATTSVAWQQLQEHSMPSLSFQDGLANLFSDQSPHPLGHPQTSPFALFVLLQGLLQKIILARQLQPVGQKTLRTHDIDMLECVLDDSRML
jgi:hypothetical protein